MDQPHAAGAHHQPPGLAVLGAPHRGPGPERTVEEPGQQLALQAEHGAGHAAGLQRGRDAVAPGQLGQRGRDGDVPGAAAAGQRAVDDLDPEARPPVLDVGGHLTVLGPQLGAAVVLARRHDQVGEHDDLVGRERGRPEHRDRRRDPHHLAGAEIGQGPPPGRGQERVAGRGAHLAAGAGAQPVDPLDAVVDERARPGAHDAAVVEGQHLDLGAAGAEAVQLGGGAQRAGRGVDDQRVGRHALAHRRPAPDHHQRAGLEAGQELVEVDVAGRHARDGVAPAVEVLQPVEVEAQQVLDLGRRVGDPALVDVVDHRLGPVERLGDVLGHAVADLGDLARHADQPAQEGVLLDDAGVARGVRRGRRRRHDVDQHLVAADGREQPVAPQLVGHGHRVDRLARGVQGVDRVEDVGVGRLVEVVGPQHPGGRGDGLGLEHHGAEQRLLRVEVVRGHTAAPGGATRGRGDVVGHCGVHPRSPVL